MTINWRHLHERRSQDGLSFRTSAEPGQRFLGENEFPWTTAEDFFLTPYLPLNSQALTEMDRTVGTRGMLPHEMWDIREIKGVHHVYHETHHAQYMRTAQGDAGHGPRRNLRVIYILIRLSILPEARSTPCGGHSALKRLASLDLSPL